MIFSSMIFIFVFLPLVVSLYYLVKKTSIRNLMLCLFSLFFYSWGEPVYVILMIFSITINYILALLMEKYHKHKKLLLLLAVVTNLFVLVFFKYGNFIIENINTLFNMNIDFLNISLPIGISFYTFQILSYVIDVYNNKCKCQKNLLNLATYISLFPQLVAGPIVRYQTIQEELSNRKESLTLFTSGLKRFIVGLSKKVIIANNMALLVDSVYNDMTGASTGILWLVAVAYALQIYFDFSGYSDMAIGLGKMFGFNFLENFNYPYIAKSITDFWRRWHISLSTWFRDYIYIPLGGNRGKKIKWIRNLLIVWVLTGLWHGASWNYVIWGLYYFGLLMFEKIFFTKVLEKTPMILKHIYTLFLVIIGWVIFRNESLDSLYFVLSNMFIKNEYHFFDYLLGHYDLLCSIPFMILGIIFSMPILKNTLVKYENEAWYNILSSLFLVVLFVLCIFLINSSTYNPFIYFRF